MGLLPELFSRPIYGKNGALGDAPIRSRGDAGYSRSRTAPTAYAAEPPHPFAVPAWEESESGWVVGWLTPAQNTVTGNWEWGFEQYGPQTGDWAEFDAMFRELFGRPKPNYSHPDYDEGAIGARIGEPLTPQELWAVTDGAQGQAPQAPEAGDHMVPDELREYSRTAPRRYSEEAPIQRVFAKSMAHGWSSLDPNSKFVAALVPKLLSQHSGKYVWDVDGYEPYKPDTHGDWESLGESRVMRDSDVSPEHLWAFGLPGGQPPQAPEIDPREVGDAFGYAKPQAPTPYGWLNAPPGVHNLNGRQYRAGQFLPGTTMFQHTPRRNNRPELPLNYDPKQERAGFETSIDENPLEATTHGAYADWLEEHGDVDEAAFRRELAALLLKRGKALHEAGNRFPWGISHYLPMPEWVGDLPTVSPARIYLTEDEEGNQWQNPDFQPGEGFDEFGHDIRYPDYRSMEQALRLAFMTTRQRPTQNSRAANYGPTPYAPLPDAQGPTQELADGTHALPTPATAAMQIPGAPQSVGGEPLHMPGAGGMSQGPPQSPGMAPQSPQQPQPPANGGMAVGAPNNALPQAAGPQPLRTPGLNPQDAVLEVQSQVFAWTNYGSLRDQYFQTNALLDPVSGDVRSVTLDPDRWQQLIPGFTGANGGVVHQAARWLNDQLFQEALTNQAGKGNNSMIVLAGGGNVGDQSAVPDLLEQSEYPLVLDQTARDFAKLNDQFDRASAAGMTPEYLYVDKPGDAAIGTAVEKAIEERRQGRFPKTTPLELMARSNIDSRRVALEVLFRRPDVRANVIDDGSQGRFRRRMITDPTQAAFYLSQRLAEDEKGLQGWLAQYKQDLIQRQKAGEIPADLVTQLIGPGWNIRPPAPWQRPVTRRPGF